MAGPRRPSASSVCWVANYRPCTPCPQQLQTFDSTIFSSFDLDTGPDTRLGDVAPRNPRWGLRERQGDPGCLRWRAGRRPAPKTNQSTPEGPWRARRHGTSRAPPETPSRRSNVVASGIGGTDRRHMLVRATLVVRLAGPGVRSRSAAEVVCPRAKTIRGTIESSARATVSLRSAPQRVPPMAKGMRGTKESSARYHAVG